MDALFVPLATATGASLDQIKLISCLIFSYPLGSVFIRLPNDNPNVKHLFNVAVSVFYLIIVLNLWTGSLQLLLDIVGTYIIALNVKGPNMPWIVFTFVMGHLTLNHIIRAMFALSYETVEVTGPQMVLVMKLTTFAWNVFDGRRPVEDLDKWQKEKRVVEYPSLLAFLGYAFYFPGILVGPYLEFADYMDLIHNTPFKALEKDMDEKRAAARVPGRLVPRGRKRVAYRKLAMGLAYLGMFVVLGGQYNYGIAIQDWFGQKSIWYRMAIFTLCGFFERTKYYAIWTLTEGAAILTGLGFTGFSPSGATLWDGAANVRVWSIEFAPNMKVLLDSWNMKTNVWLRECVYKRVTPKGKKAGFRESLITFMTSAFWHGVAGGYYLTFAFGAFIQTVGRLCRSNIRPLVLPADYVTSRTAPPPPQTPIKIAYDIAGTVFSVYLLNYLAAPFMLLTIKDSLLGWSRLWWTGHIVVGGALVFFYGGGIHFLRGVQKARMKAAGVPMGVVKPANGSVSGTVTPGVQTMPPLDDFAKEVERRMGE